MKNTQVINKLLSKLRTPLHFDYICKHIIKMNKTECIDILSELKENDIIEENNHYYKIKTK